MADNSNVEINEVLEIKSRLNARRSFTKRFQRILESTSKWILFLFYMSVEFFTGYINKIQQDATVCRYLITAKSIYMFRVSIALIIRSA